MRCVLIGLKHSGKTSVGTSLARRCRSAFVDTDALLLQQHSSESILTVSALFASQGEVVFRRLEHEVIRGLVDSAMPSASRVIATGGGSLVNPENVRCLQQLGPLIYLRLSFVTWMERLRAHPRPMFVSPTLEIDQLQALYATRHAVYSAAATCTLDADTASVIELQEQIIHWETCRHGE